MSDPSNITGPSAHDATIRELIAKAAAGIATPADLELLARLDAQESDGDALALEREAHATIDASLARLFAEPPATLPLALPNVLERKLSLRWLAIIGGGLAAGIAAVVAMSLITQGPGSPSANPDFRPRLAAEFVYDTSVSMGFRPEWRCESDDEFAIAVRDRLGTAMVVPLATTGIELVGWGYSDRYGAVIISDDTMVLLARVEGEQVVVFVDRAGGKVNTNARGSSTALNVFERTVGPLMLVEVTPRSEPGILPAAKLLSPEDAARLPATPPATPQPSTPLRPTNPG